MVVRREPQANIMLAVTPEAFVSDDHLLRRIKPLVGDCLERLSPCFEGDVRKVGRPLPPEHLLRGGGARPWGDAARGPQRPAAVAGPSTGARRGTQSMDAACGVGSWWRIRLFLAPPSCRAFHR